jgi:hypothetical protein
LSSFASAPADNPIILLVGLCSLMSVPILITNICLATLALIGKKRCKILERPRKIGP